MLDVVELLPNLVLPMLAPRDEIVKDRFREVRFLNLLLLLAQLIAQLRLLIEQFWPFIISMIDCQSWLEPVHFL